MLIAIGFVLLISPLISLSAVTALHLAGMVGSVGAISIFYNLTERL